MKRASLRSEPVSIHLQHRREFLERHGMEHPAAGNVVDAHTASTVLPFERRDDEDENPGPIQFGEQT
jgi:hypothetical protein